MTYTWGPLQGNDINKLVELSNTHFRHEVDELFDIDLVYLEKCIAHGFINQLYSPLSELLSVAKDESGKVIAWTWAKVGERAVWSTDPILTISMAHIDMSLSPKARVRIVNDMLDLWERFAHLARTPIICSTTMRKEQSAFLKLHERKGYKVRNNVAYKRLNLTQATPAN